MNESEKKARLIVQHGAQKGKKFELKKQIVLVGSESSCDIKISGEYVSPRHAQFQLRDDGIWMIRNESINGTLLNQQNIDIKPLQDKDVIQIGSQTLLRFEQTEIKKVKKTRENNNSGKSSATGKAISAKQITIAAGLIIYLAIMGFIALSLSSKESTDTQRITKAGSEKKVSKQELLGCLVKTIRSGQSTMYIIDKNDLASEYHLVRSKAQQGADEEEISLVLDIIIEKANTLFFNAWILEQQKNYPAAIKSYHQIEQLIPDIRCPSSTYILAQIKRIEKLSEK